MAKASISKALAATTGAKARAAAAAKAPVCLNIFLLLDTSLVLLLFVVADNAVLLLVEDLVVLMVVKASVDERAKIAKRMLICRRAMISGVCVYYVCVYVCM